MHKKHFFSFLFEQGEKYRFSIELKMLSYRAHIRFLRYFFCLFILIQSSCLEAFLFKSLSERKHSNRNAKDTHITHILIL